MRQEVVDEEKTLTNAIHPPLPPDVSRRGYREGRQLSRLLRGESLCHFSDFEPAEFGGLDLRSVPGNALRELREAIGVSGIEIRIRECSLVGGDFRLQLLDLTRKPVEIALVLVGELLIPRRRPGSGSAGRR